MFYILKIGYHRNSYNRMLFLLSILLSPKKRGRHANNTRNPLLNLVSESKIGEKLRLKRTDCI